MKAVLIFTHQRGFESDPVIDRLRSEQIPVFRLNTDIGKEVPSVSLRISDDGMGAVFGCEGREITSGDIGVGWCQQLPPYHERHAEEWRQAQQHNFISAWLGAFDVLNVPWLNRPFEVMRASNKAFQLVCAQRVGLRTANTFISNDTTRIQMFGENYPIVAKNLATSSVGSNDDPNVAYTKLVEPKWLLKPEELTFCPVIYQQYHRRAKDYRVVVVGEKTFAVSCVAGSKEQEADVRRGVRTGDHFEVCEFDSQTTRRLHMLMNLLSLQYCAADFMEDEEGNVYFLEVNTCGSWWWVDQIHNGAVCEAITNFLKQGISR